MKARCENDTIKQKDIDKTRRQKQKKKTGKIKKCKRTIT